MTESNEKIIAIGDQPATEDTLGFSPYVIAMTEFLTNPNTQPPLTIAIEGAWGSGKSSFMKQLETEIKKKSKELEKEELKEIEKRIKTGNFSIEHLLNYFKSKLGLKQKTQTIWFNAWRHDKVESLSAAFALSFLEQISENRDWTDIAPNLLSHVWLLRSRLNWRRNWLEILQKTATSIFIVAIAVTIPYLYIINKDNLETFSKDIVCQLEQTQDSKSETAKEEKSSDNKSETQKKQESSNNKCSDKSPVLLNILLFLMGGGGSLSASFILLSKLRDFIGNHKLDLKEYLESPDYDKQVAFIETFHQDFPKIVRAYAGKNEKVYVFIDDLDRCELGKGADLLQGLNLMISNDPNLIFILGMDRDKVAASITFKQKDVIPYLAEFASKTKEQENDQSKKILDYGYSFMEKFIQLTFSIPQPSLDRLNACIDPIFQNKNSQEKYYFTIPHSLIIKITNPIKSTVFKFKQKINKIRKKEATPEIQDTENPVSQKASSDDLAIFPIIQKNLTSESLADIIKMVAPFFNYNPRRLKQYVNVLRLRTYIVYYALGVTFEERETITLEQMGKCIAIGLKCPLLFNKVKEDDEILSNLENYAVKLRLETSSQTTDNTIESPETKTNNQDEGDTKYWLNNYPELKELLLYGLSDNDKSPYSLNSKEMKKLLQVSPPQKLSSKYFKLRELLAARKWKEADYETYICMITAVGRSEGDYFRVEDIDNFPCEDLRIIDQLWVRYSNGKFGFSVQAEIYRSLGGTREYNEEVWRKFGDSVGWHKEGSWLRYADLDYTINAKVAHLPFCSIGVFYWCGLEVVFLLSRQDL